MGYSHTKSHKYSSKVIKIPKVTTTPQVSSHTKIHYLMRNHLRKRGWYLCNCSSWVIHIPKVTTTLQGLFTYHKSLLVPKPLEFSGVLNICDLSIYQISWFYHPQRYFRCDLKSYFFLICRVSKKFLLQKIMSIGLPIYQTSRLLLSLDNFRTTSRETFK